MKLKGKVAIITGSARGIGFGCGRVFAKEGASITVADINEEIGPKAAKEFKSLGGDAFFCKTDVSDSKSVQAMITGTVKAYSRIDILINNAGYHISKNVEETSEEEWEYIINTNLRSTFLCSKYAIPHLRKTKGCIINISSMVGLVGQSNAGAYSASKGGQVAMTKGMALDFAKDGIRVNCICPGWVETPLVEDWFSQQKNPDEVRKHVYSIHPLGRIGTTEECGRAALFLATEDSSFITGIALPVDGAVTLGY
jgi:NAD(P)-dependent dehydrogenase (short-subunit alcohol dehydrogenase family)